MATSSAWVGGARLDTDLRSQPQSDGRTAREAVEKHVPMERHGILSLVLAVLVVAGCGSAPPPSATPLPSGHVAIRTLSGQMPSGVTFGACGGVGFFDSVLHGDPTAAVPVWIEPLSPGPARKIEVVWPFGFSARFVPSLELLDSSGMVIAREGDRLTDLGGSANSEAEWLIYEVNGRQYQCY
jgi:hypothetical protein